MRFRFQIHVLTVPVPDGEIDVNAVVKRFIDTYEARFGEGLGVLGRRRGDDHVPGGGRAPSRTPALAGAPAANGAAPDERQVFTDGEWKTARVLREAGAGLELDGLAIIELPDTTIVIGEGQRADRRRPGQRDPRGCEPLRMTVTPRPIDPITFEVIRHKLWSINEEGSATMIHVSGSPVVHATDYNFGIYAAEGEMAVIGVYLLVPIYTGYMAIREFLVAVRRHRRRATSSSSTTPTWPPSTRTTSSSARRSSTTASWSRGSAAWRTRSISAALSRAAGARPRPTSTRRGCGSRPGASCARARSTANCGTSIIANSRMPFTVSNDFTRVPGRPARWPAAARRAVRPLRRRHRAQRHAARRSRPRSKGLRELLRTLPDGVVRARRATSTGRQATAPSWSRSTAG